MLDASNRVKRYREPAAGYRGFAAIGLSFETGDHFPCGAERCGRLAKESATLPDAPGD